MTGGTNKHCSGVGGVDLIPVDTMQSKETVHYCLNEERTSSTLRSTFDRDLLTRLGLRHTRPVPSASSRDSLSHVKR